MLESKIEAVEYDGMHKDEMLCEELCAIHSCLFDCLFPVYYGHKCNIPSLCTDLSNTDGALWGNMSYVLHQTEVAFDETSKTTRGPFVSELLM